MENFEILYDISMEISPEMQVYKGKEEKKPLFEQRSNHQNSTAYETAITFDMHTGTHIDAPLHMIENGDTMDYFHPGDILSDCLVLDLTGVEGSISDIDLEKAEQDIEKGEIVLLKSKNSFQKREEDFIYLAESGAEFLINKGIKGVGIDTPGIERNQEGHPTHKKILGKGIIIIEGLVLKDVPAGRYRLLLVPLKIKDVEAAPARAFLIAR